MDTIRFITYTLLRGKTQGGSNVILHLWRSHAVPGTRVAPFPLFIMRAVILTACVVFVCVCVCVLLRAHLYQDGLNGERLTSLHHAWLVVLEMQDGGLHVEVFAHSMATQAFGYIEAIFLRNALH